MMRRALVAMSGGVDSSVAALLMMEQGWEVIGLSLRLWHESDDRCAPGGCCSADEIEDARRVCRRLGIRHYALDLSSEFRRLVVDHFIAQYRAGRTPNPCIDCNEHIKFRMLLDRALALDCSVLATGHYARIAAGPAAGAPFFHLRTAADTARDQSYVLYRLTQRELAGLAFPLGAMTKTDARALAAARGLCTADKPDSQEICFVRGRYEDAIERLMPGEIDPSGPIIDAAGVVIGRHEGIHRYTIGQRSGLGPGGAPVRYVTRIDAATNTIVAGSREEVFSTSLTAGRLSWTGRAIAEPFDCRVKIRRMHEPAPARVVVADGRARVEFVQPQWAVTPGQAAVWYSGDDVLGGGEIEHPGI